MMLLALAAIALLALVPASAAADGLPGTGVVSSPVSAPGGDVEYVAKSAKRDTVLREQRLNLGPVLRTLDLRGRYSVPAVAYDGSPSGLSADGRTLVLINPRKRWPRKHTTFAVVDARRMELRRHIRLRGDFSFDAISPDGQIAYFIEYLSPNDATAYAVRAYDMRARRLFQEPVVDPSEPDEDMSGFPMTRAMGLDGRWAYTLYDGSEHPFIHALDTERREAVCIDMDMLAGRSNGIGDLELRPSDGRLDVLAGTQVLASVDTTTHELIPRRAAARRPAPSDEAGFPWLVIAGPTAALMLLAAVGRRRVDASAP